MTDPLRAMTVFGASLARHARRPDAPPALVLPDRTIGYAELLDRVDACAAWLVREGCATKEVVGLTIADEPTHLVASLALLRLGVPQVCLPTHDPAATRRRLARRLPVARLIADEAAHALEGIPACTLTARALRALPAAAAPRPLAADPDATAIYFTSSGTTGQPKVVALSQRLMARRARRLAECQAFTAGERVLMAVTVENYPAKTTRLYCLALGVTSVLQGAPSPSAPSILELCARLGVTCLELTVLQAQGVVLAEAPAPPLADRIKVFVGGSRVPAKLREALRERVGPRVYVNYGAQEIWRMASTFPRDPDPGAESVGAVPPWVELEIVDAAGAPLPPGEIGEIRVRSECMIHGYVLDPVATARHFRDGWFYPGDLGSLTPGGSLRLHGRRDDMMNLNSIKIFPAEIERVMEEHPDVRAAAAFAIPSATHGDIPAVAVELHASARASVQDLMARARDRLGVRAPRKIVVLEALPRNAAGKIARRALASLLAPKPR